MTKPAEPSLHEQCRYTCKAEAAAAVPRMVHSLCDLRVECGGGFFRRLLVQAMSRNRRSTSSALLALHIYASLFFTNCYYDIKKIISTIGDSVSLIPPMFFFRNRQIQKADSPAYPCECFISFKQSRLGGSFDRKASLH